ncbi:hypothetical protein AM629_13280 [Photorhabdus heterorhabditis]|uniref:Nucleoid-associated protein n=1 Tax=Photorhabdus heterorhabditis TaxID=880156 RepID=A0ABR5KC58_9GAMM|nr:hypothetical protein [Photorhabdus heterorhabditis]KOY61586.1 hypothetical protein AM629_13280 [Photorhabdus heterorhabditis]
MANKVKELFNNFCELAKKVNHDDNATTVALCKTADSIEELQEQFTTYKSKYYAAIGSCEAVGYFSYSPEIGLKIYASYDEAITAANNEINVYRRCTNDDGWNEDINHIFCGVITQKATLNNQDYRLQGINPNTIIRKIQSDAEHSLVEKIGDMYDAATSINEKNIIGQTYYLLKYGILKSRDSGKTKEDVMSEYHKSVVARLVYIAEKTNDKSIIKEILQTTSISKKSLSGALEHDVAKIRKNCPYYWDAPLGLGADYKGLHIESIGEDICIKDSQGRFYIEVPSHINIADVEKLLNQWLSQMNRS